jgi:phosphoglycerate dehydrogenase-like enzyme
LSASDDVPLDGEVVLLTNTHTRLAQWSTLRPRTRFLLHPNSGFENLLPLWDVPVVLGNAIRARAVADWALSCLLQHATPVRDHARWPRGRGWGRPRLQELRILVLGQGPVGVMIAQGLRGLGAAPQIHDPHLQLSVPLTQAWDAVMVAASANPGNRGLVNDDMFSALAPGAVLVNPARAELVEHAGLTRWLQRDPAARAYLDVHPVEPFTDEGHPQMIRTPHIAGVWQGLIEEMLRFERQVLEAWMAQGPQGLQRFPLVADRMTPQGWYR